MNEFVRKVDEKKGKRLAGKDRTGSGANLESQEGATQERPDEEKEQAEAGGHKSGAVAPSSAVKDTGGPEHDDTGQTGAAGENAGKRILGSGETDGGARPLQTPGAAEKEAAERTEGKKEEEEETSKPRRGRGGGVKMAKSGEVRTVVQHINEAELSRAIAVEKNDGARASMAAILAKQRNGTLKVEYRPKKAGEGRWYATGRAQLQSCRREVRAAALKGMGWEIDLRASFPMIVLGLMGDLARQGEMRADTGAIEEYVRETEQVRRQVADDYRTSMKAAKKLFNSVMFGRSVAKWKKVEKIRDTAKSSIAEKFEKEMKKARVLIAEQELKKCRGRDGKSDRTLMAEAVSREEEFIMLKIQRNLEKLGWKTGTLIRDAITVQKQGQEFESAEQAKLSKAVEATLAEAMEERGWRQGTARAKVTRM